MSNVSNERDFRGDKGLVNVAGYSPKFSLPCQIHLCFIEFLFSVSSARCFVLWYHDSVLEFCRVLRVLEDQWVLQDSKAMAILAWL